LHQREEGEPKLRFLIETSNKNKSYVTTPSSPKIAPDITEVTQEFLK